MLGGVEVVQAGVDLGTEAGVGKRYFQCFTGRQAQVHIHHSADLQAERIRIRDDVVVASEIQRVLCVEAQQRVLVQRRLRQVEGAVHARLHPVQGFVEAVEFERGERGQRPDRRWPLPRHAARRLDLDAFLRMGAREVLQCDAEQLRVERAADSDVAADVVLGAARIAQLVEIDDFLGRMQRHPGRPGRRHC